MAVENDNRSETQEKQPMGELNSLCTELERMLLRTHQYVIGRVRDLEKTIEMLTKRNQELEEGNVRLQWLSAEMERLAMTDELTGLWNRRVIETIAEAEVRRQNRYPCALALGILDADKFKEINSGYGQPGGDQALIGIARALTGALRSTDRVGRISGEEFLIIAPDSDLAGTSLVAERIRSTIERAAISYEGQEIRVTVSIGFAVASAGARATCHELTHMAAQALTEAKTSSRNRAVIRSM
jgi:diguanylate cyclase (GGDEF)-like protein